MLITWDIDPLTVPELIRERLDVTSNPTALLHRALGFTAELLDELNIDSTFFVSGSVAEMLRDELVRLVAAGHEIGCHGYTHDENEFFDLMPKELQRKRISIATSVLHAITGKKITAFRAPRLRLSGATVQVLEELGYVIDSSISSQRIDFLSSSLGNPRAIFAPRNVYHPSLANPFIAGNSALWEIPVSAYILPFISGTLSIFGLDTMKRLFRRLYREAKETGKPIVYLSHPTEFMASPTAPSIPRRWMLPSTQWLKEGLPFRHIFFATDGNKLYSFHRILFKYIAGFENVEFITMQKYFDEVLKK